MKHQQAPKWLLTTALLAVLGANYSFQSSSLSLHQDMGLFELSSETSGGRGSAGSEDQATNAQTALLKLEKTGSTGSTGKTVKFEISGASVEGQCNDPACKSAVLEASKIEAFAKQLIAAAGKLAPTTTTTVAAAPVATALPAATVATRAEIESEYDCDEYQADGEETAAAKHRRERNLKACVKEEKERVKREDRIAKFEVKMNSIKDRCEVSASESKLECLSREFNQALSRYSDRNAIPSSVVQRYFKTVVGSELSKMLFNSDVDPQQAMSMLQDVFDGVPADYSVIRQNILSAIQTETKTRSQVINQQYKLAGTLINKPHEYLQTIGEAQQAQAELAQMVNVYSAAAHTSDSFSGDTSFARYYQTNYMPSMRRLFALMGPPGSTGATATEDGVVNNTRGNTRGSATTGTPSSIPSAGGTRGAATTTTKIDAGAPTPWEFLNSSGGVRTGNPSNTSIGGTRGARSIVKSHDI